MMNNYEVIIQNTHSGALPQELRFKRFLFNEPKHIMSQDCDEIHHFYLLNKINDCVDAQFNLFVKEQSGISPAKAPFGSIKFFHGLEREVLCHFIEQILAFAQQLNLVSIQITSYPDCYEPHQANLLRECLISEFHFRNPLPRQEMTSLWSAPARLGRNKAHPQCMYKYED